MNLYLRIVGLMLEDICGVAVVFVVVVIVGFFYDMVIVDADADFEVVVFCVVVCE